MKIAFLQMMVYLGWCISISGCSTPTTVVFSSTEPVRLSLVPLEGEDGQDKDLGQAPVTLDVNQARDKIIHIASQDGRALQNWIIASDLGKKYEVHLDKLGTKFWSNDPSTCKATTPAAQNEAFRTLLKAYEALMRHDYEKAHVLAQKLAETDHTIAAPHIILGLVYLQTHDKERARLAFLKAKSLDPEDTSLHQLIESVR